MKQNSTQMISAQAAAVWTARHYLERFVAAVASGKDARRRLTPSGLSQLTRHRLWPQAMRQVVELGVAHPAAQRWFLNSWTRVPASTMFRDFVGDDALLIAALRILLPRYDGPPMELWRGQLANEPIGLSWARQHHIAVKFALYGVANVDPLNLYRARIPARRNAIVLHVVADPANIISAPCLRGAKEGEYILDPRNIAPHDAEWCSVADPDASPSFSQLVPCGGMR